MNRFQIGDFEFGRDQYSWVLDQWVPGKDKDGNPKRRKHTTWHSSLEQVLKVIVDRSAGECKDAVRMLEYLKGVQAELAKGLIKGKPLKDFTLAEGAGHD